MSAHVYPRRELAADYLRGAAGLACSLGIFLVVDPHPAVAGVALVLAFVFALFTGRTALRQLTRFETGDQGIAARGPASTAIAWDELSDLRLRYYSTRRDREKGWMQLSLRGRRRRLRLESSLTGFEDVVERAARAAEANGLSLSDTTVSNLEALGIHPSADQRPERDDWIARLRREPGDDGGQGSEAGGERPARATGGGA